MECSIIWLDLTDANDSLKPSHKTVHKDEQNSQVASN